MYTNINTVEKAYEALNLDPAVRPVITNVIPEFGGLLEKIYDACIVSKAIREEWVPDYQTNTPKWESWYILRKDSGNPSGFRFYDSVSADTNTYSVLGPLLCQESEEKDIFFSTTFAPLLGEIANHPLLHKLNN